ncbi:MAG: CDP-diacylglycerol--serine O-phosphatidyltransferase [Candidatus Aenigmarchaeota archaeon]|nr:CDP-diacylglycerol--serine O-phosphatidyltransferase [Candidatus Aenigmarchaeota archaeon]
MPYKYKAKGKRRAASARIRTGLPTFFTVANAISGFLSIIHTARGAYSDAAIFIFVAMLFDAVDGRVARKMGVTSDFGVEIDSLADAISFGAAPAFLAYAAWFQPYGYLGMLIASSLVVGGILRLARFNLLGPEPYFIGLPIPAVGAFLAMLVLSGTNIAPNQLAIWVLALSYLMVSNIRYPNFKQRIRTKNMSLFIFGFALLAVVVMLIDPNKFLVFPFLYYILAGPIIEAKKRQN